jgi:hypothetical protein
MTTRDPDQPTRITPKYDPTQPIPTEQPDAATQRLSVPPEIRAAANQGYDATQEYPPYQTGSPPITLSPPPDLAPATPASAGTVAKVIVPVAIGAAVAVVLGTYGKQHTPTGIAVNVAGFSGPLTVKVWLATAGVTLAVVQLLTALAMYGRLPGVKGGWLGPVHRWSGRIAFLLTVPVVIHCLYALGFSDYSTRTLAHSLLGCLFFGVFTTKMLVLTKRGLAGWVLPLFGGLVFSALVGVWATSALWFFATSGIQF